MTNSLISLIDKRLVCVSNIFVRLNSLIDKSNDWKWRSKRNSFVFRKVWSFVKALVHYSFWSSDLEYCAVTNDYIFRQSITFALNWRFSRWTLDNFIDFCKNVKFHFVFNKWKKRKDGNENFTQAASSKWCSYSLWLTIDSEFQFLLIFTDCITQNASQSIKYFISIHLELQ